MIIGISGPSGAGKDIAAKYIQEKFDFKHISGGDILREMITKIGFSPKKEAVNDLGTLLRNNYGADAIVKPIISRGLDSNITFSGFRSPEVAKLIKQSDGIILYIDASQEMRHERIAARARSDDSDVNMVAQDKREASSGKLMAENLESVYAIADFIVDNDSSIDALYTKLDAIYAKLSESSAL